MLDDYDDQWAAETETWQRNITTESPIEYGSSIPFSLGLIFITLSLLLLIWICTCFRANFQKNNSGSDNNSDATSESELDYSLYFISDEPDYFNDLTIDVNTISTFENIEIQQRSPPDLPPPGYNEIIKIEEILPSYEEALRMTLKINDPDCFNIKK